MIVCPKCGAENGKRVANPVKCCRCWYQLQRAEIKNCPSCGGMNGMHQKGCKEGSC
jgi:ribosomal protein L32